MPTLLIVHHTPSPALQAMFESVLAGANDPELSEVDVVRRPALSATASDVLAADGVVLGTPANIGYMSGALKHFFDTIYYPCLDATQGRPFGFYVHGNQGTEGAVRSVESVAKGLGWTPVAEPVVVMGEASKDDLQRCWELGATVAAQLLP
ncbi:flavodoxin family protein [Actinokineospora iranica]|uniref:NADPH-dependent FMN reductase n=1 Tax=Actinokineospora iranica TaxID=1271860 RepID=A0A1G6SSA5_9PSEU|nr:NAD(P)H-dependent oxidoreductase [Actinokineospora iranica]SDD19713.1 NADPH-dependent FMN reductase [Actinokineospora iranica]